MHPPIEKPVAAIPTSAKVVARPRREKLNPCRARAFRFTALARVDSFHGYDARALLHWLRGVGDEIGQ